ncbi:hypothetical protein [Tuberibacillus sp. Marseille-P3662]|uniref:hypothetical protein n=1 Tax=Tuberibacillus sp. Marseille-P3662 TaxID=1965358 RepID=UPI000A1CE0B8|nr:hypothetical protein [Tuberibacillus sp. Marseille-P3662]
MRKSAVLLLIVVVLTILCLSRSYSYSQATVPVTSSFSIKSAQKHNPIHLYEDKGQQGVVRIANNRAQPVRVEQNKVFPVKGVRDFYIIIKETEIPAQQTGELPVVVYGNKRTPPGEYQLPLQLEWNKGTAAVQVTIRLDNQIKAKGHQPKTDSQSSHSSSLRPPYQSAD